MESRRGGLVIPEMRVGDEAMRRLWLVVVGVDGVLVPVPVPGVDSDVLTAGVREESPRPVTVLVAGLACSATSGCGTDCGCSPGTCCSLGSDMTAWLLSAGAGGTSSGCCDEAEVGGR